MGWLRTAYAVRKRTVPLTDRPGLDMRSRAAAKAALDLNSREPRALGALLLLDPVYRHWLTTERADRDAVKKNSSIPLLLSITSDMLGNVGRWKEARSFSQRMDRTHFLIPGADRSTSSICGGQATSRRPTPRFKRPSIVGPNSRKSGGSGSPT